MLIGRLHEDKERRGEYFVMATKVDIKALLDAGVHFGHKTSRWHPKMAPFIHSKRGEAHVIDLTKTVAALEEAIAFLTKTAAAGKQVLLVGTKRQAKAIVEKAAADSSQPFVTARWMGGMLTNQKTMNGRIKHLKKLEERMASGELEGRYNKLEVQRFQEEIDHMNNMFGGIKEMRGNPGAVLVFDVVNDAIAVREARRLNIPVVALVDTNGDPSGIDYPIPANDDAIKGLELLASYFVTSINEGRGKAKTDSEADKTGAPVKTSARTKADATADKTKSGTNAKTSAAKTKESKK